MSTTKSIKCLGNKPLPMLSFGNAIPLRRPIITAPQRKPWHPLFNHTSNNIIIIIFTVLVKSFLLQIDPPWKGTAVMPVDMNHRRRRPRPPPPLLIINTKNTTIINGISIFPSKLDANVFPMMRLVKKGLVWFVGCL